MEVFDRAKVKTYFMGKSLLGPIILIIFAPMLIGDYEQGRIVITLLFYGMLWFLANILKGFIGKAIKILLSIYIILTSCTTIIQSSLYFKVYRSLNPKEVIGFLLLIGGIIWFLINKFGIDISGEKEVDKAKAAEIQKAQQEAMEKLNLIHDQIENVKPVVVSGPGFEPDSPTTRKLATSSILKNLIVKNSDDPIYISRIGSDDKLRYSLVCTTVFMFGEKQVYIYYANVDLTTGLVYSEGTHEYFYTDINAISFEQNRNKVFNLKTKKFERKLFENVVIHSSGCCYTASLATGLDRSIVETEFMGMRNLIRERKNAN